jgi:hypothetical protein
MCAGVNRDPANRVLVVVGTGGDHHHSVVSDDLPSFKRSRRIVDLIYSHAKLDTVTYVL